MKIQISLLNNLIITLIKTYNSKYTFSSSSVSGD